MALYPNQKTVVIDKPLSFSTYAIYGKPEICIACKVLNGSAFKVWCYLLGQKAQVNWDISPQHAYYEWGISPSTFADGINELKEKGFLDDKAIHLISAKPESEIRKKKRKPRKSENRIENHTNFVESDSEFQWSNSINNTIKDNKDVLDANVSNTINYPTEKSSYVDYLFKDTENYNWRDYVDENGIYTTPTNRKIKIIFDN